MTKPLGSRIKALRAKRGWTQTQLARRAGISRGYLARLEINRHDPALSALQKLAKALGVRIGRLVE